MPTALELLRLLRENPPQNKPPQAQAPPRHWASGMRLDEFAQSGRVLRLWSSVLRDEIFVAADNAVLQDAGTPNVSDGCVIYRARELPELQGMTADGLRLLHTVKRAFGGEVLASSSEAP